MTLSELKNKLNANPLDAMKTDAPYSVLLNADLGQWFRFNMNITF